MTTRTIHDSLTKNLPGVAVALFGALALAAGCAADLAGPGANEDCVTCDGHALDGDDGSPDQTGDDPRGAVHSSDGTFSEGGGAAPPADITPPDPVTGMDATTPTRRSIYASWTAPADDDLSPVAGYVVRIALEELTDENFSTTGYPVDFVGTPSAPGQTDSITIDHLRAGTEYHVGVAAMDAAGNRSEVRNIGPRSPDFKAGAALSPEAPESYAKGLGYAVTHGRFSASEDYEDVAVSAPFVDVDGKYEVGAVYVYFGGADGISEEPDVIIEGLAEGGRLGFSMATLDWNGDGVADLAIGAPYDDDWQGRVYVFFGSEQFGGLYGTLSVADADVVIEAAPDYNWFSWAGIGWALTAGRFDSDDRDDLVLGMPYGNGVGGVAVIYGGTTEAALIQLSDTDAEVADGAAIHLLEAPELARSETFAVQLANLGRVAGPAGQGTDSIGIVSKLSNSVYVIRGRALPQSDGVTMMAFDAQLDARILGPDRYIRFGQSLGSIADQNEDGHRELVIGAFRSSDDAGRVWIVDGGAVGTVSVESLALATISGAAGENFGAAVVNNAGASTADVDGDGQEDLIIVGGTADGSQALHIWYGGELPVGEVSSASAAHTFAAPGTYRGDEPSFGGTPARAIWGGDANGDGIENLYWSHWDTSDTSGAFMLLYDPGM